MHQSNADALYRAGYGIRHSQYFHAWVNGPENLKIQFVIHFFLAWNIALFRITKKMTELPLFLGYLFTVKERSGWHKPDQYSVRIRNALFVLKLRLTSTGEEFYLSLLSVNEIRVRKNKMVKKESWHKREMYLNLVYWLISMTSHPRECRMRLLWAIDKTLHPHWLVPRRGLKSSIPWLQLHRQLALLKWKLPLK